MFSPHVSELTHRIQINECYRSSNKVDARQQILEIGTRRLIFQLRLLNLKVLYKNSVGSQGGLLDFGSNLELISDGQLGSSQFLRTALPPDIVKRKSWYINAQACCS